MRRTLFILLLAVLTRGTLKAQSFESMLKNARQGNAVAQLYVGMHYESGNGVAKDETKALYWFDKAAKQNVAQAKYKIGEFYHQGKAGVKKDLQQALYWYKKSAQQNDIYGQRGTAACYEEQNDKKRALYWLERAKSNTDFDSQSDYFKNDVDESIKRLTAGQETATAKSAATPTAKVTPAEEVKKAAPAVKEKTVPAVKEQADPAAKEKKTEMAAPQPAAPAPVYGGGEASKVKVEAVDLGLSVRWAVCNVGAAIATQGGGLYGWGDATGAKTATSESYPNATPPQSISGTPFDIAHAQWGGSWRMPTKAEMDELRTKCTWTWTSAEGAEGMKVTGRNGHSIFLPAAGFRYSSIVNDKHRGGFYWTGTINASDTKKAHFLVFSDDKSGFVNDSSDERCAGFSVRPVTE
jgi:hypothetical protein